MIRDINPRENKSSRKLIHLRYFERLPMFLSTQNYAILETTNNEKKLLKKLKLLLIINFLNNLNKFTISFDSKSPSQNYIVLSSRARQCSRSAKKETSRS